MTGLEIPEIDGLILMFCFYWFYLFHQIRRIESIIEQIDPIYNDLSRGLGKYLLHQSDQHEAGTAESKSL